MTMNTTNEIAQKALQLIEDCRRQPLTIEGRNGAIELLDNIECEVLELAKKIASVKAPTCFINLNKDNIHRRPYYIHGAHAGYITYAAEPFCDAVSYHLDDIVGEISDLISSRFIDDKAPSRKTYGCLRFDTADCRAIVNASAVVAITECKHERSATAVVHLNSGREIDSGLSYETLVTAYLDYLGRERGTIKSPAGV